MLIFRLAARFVAIILVTCWASSAPLAQTIDEITDRVRAARLADEKAANIRILDSMISTAASPQAEIYLRALRAESQLSLANHREAMVDLDVIISSDQPSWETRGYILTLRGGIFQQQGDHERARSDYLALRDTPGWSAEGSFNLAYLALEQRKFADVIEWVSAIPPSHALRKLALLARGTANRALENLEPALADQEAVLALDPLLEVAARERAYVLAEMGRHEQALTILQSLRDQAPSRLKDAYLIDMIPIYMAAGRNDEARRAADAIAVRFESLGWRAVIDAQQNAGRGIRKIDTRGADIPVSWPLVLASLYGGLAGPRQVLQSIESDPFARSSGIEIQAYYAIAHFHLAQGDREAARQAFLHCIATGSIERAEFLGARLGLQRLAR